MSLLNSRFAGAFYPAHEELLSKQMTDLFTDTEKTIRHPSALMVPHAGYIYSGRTAAHGYRQMEGETYDRAIILGPSHQVFHTSFVMPHESQVATPFGPLDMDTELIDKLMGHPIFRKDSAPHEQEHSLEVQMPFLKYMAPDIKVIPISIGGIGIEQAQMAAKALVPHIDNQTLLIISSDLSHYHSLHTARSYDEKTIDIIMQLNIGAFLKAHQNKDIELCGVYPILFALEIFSQIGPMGASLLNYDTSATASLNDKEVVGYASIAFTKN